MEQSEIPVYKLTEKYFTNTMIVQLKAYIMIQLSYLTRATKVLRGFYLFIFIYIRQDEKNTLFQAMRINSN